MSIRHIDAYRRNRSQPPRRPGRSHRSTQPLGSLGFKLAWVAVLLALAILIAMSPDWPGRNCTIKGNVAQDTGERIYHLPGQEYYEETTIRFYRGERWFCSEAEAVAAGWRRSRR